MAYFTFDLPCTNDKLLKVVIIELKRIQKHEVAYLLDDASLSITEGGYSYYDGGGRSDAHSAYIQFYVNPQRIDSLDNKETKELLTNICDKLIPAEVGFDVKSVSFAIDLTKDFTTEDDLFDNLEELSNKVSSKVISKLLPPDIKEKGYYMSEIYTYLYAVENSLRLFIETVAKEIYGDTYFESLKIPTSTINNLNDRIKDSEAKKWLSIRSDSKLFYLDFRDLASVIEMNWAIFKSYFPSQDFIIPKIKEMADCRNLVAHNSMVGGTEKSLIKTYYTVILKQINEKIK